MEGSEAKENQLIYLVEKFPFLYNKQSKLYKNKIAVENAWMEISKKLNIDGKY